MLYHICDRKNLNDLPVLRSTQKLSQNKSLQNKSPPLLWAVFSIDLRLEVLLRFETWDLSLETWDHFSPLETYDLARPPWPDPRHAVRQVMGAACLGAGLSGITIEDVASAVTLLARCRLASSCARPPCGTFDRPFNRGATMNKPMPPPWQSWCS